jgi:cell pole-organizing protein PopZ
MGDISAEPSMEEILSSIKRIIAEEGEGAMSAARAKRQTRPAPRIDPTPEPFGHDEILELSDPVEMGSDDGIDAYAEEEFAVPKAETPAVPAEPILSPRTAQATRGPLDTLSRMVVKPDVAGSDTLESLVREMLRPMLRDWLDANLPGMVERMVSREISRITGK